MSSTEHRFNDVNEFLVSIREYAYNNVGKVSGDLFVSEDNPRGRTVGWRSQLESFDRWCLPLTALKEYHSKNPNALLLKAFNTVAGREAFARSITSGLEFHRTHGSD